MSNFILNVGDLVRQKQGTRIGFNLDEKVDFDFDADVKLIANLKTEITLMKMDDGIHAHSENLETKVEFKCNKCGKPFNVDIEIPTSERIYYFEKQQETADAFDYFYVDMKNMEVDVSDFLRQEIILHFPMIPVCSNSCKGLCPKCGTDLNKKTCSCDTSSDSEKPLAKLKDLYNA